MKDAYYFPYDSNSKDDPKCVLLIEQLGLEGYGAFWVLVEILREQSNFKYPLALIPALARRFNTSTEKLKAVVFNYNLFEVENDQFFYSESLINRMKFLEEKRAKRSLAGIAGNEKRWGNVAIESQCDRKTSLSKVKESKVKQFIEPTLEEIKNYCSERKNNVNPQKWIDHYIANGWMVGKTKMKDWKAAVRTWENNNYDTPKVTLEINSMSSRKLN